PWSATELPDRHLVVVHAEPYEQFEDPDLLDESLLVQRIENLGNASTLSDYADKSMRRFVRQGDAERSTEFLVNRSALRYEWSDGVAKVVTFFLEPSSHRWFRVEYANKDHSLREPDIRDRAGRLLRGFQWQTPAASDAVSTSPSATCTTPSVQPVG